MDTETILASGAEDPVKTRQSRPARPGWPRQKVISDSFRLVAFGAALLQIGAFPNGPGYTASDLTWLVAVAGAYTILKIAQPFRWQQARASNSVLLLVDIVAAAMLIRFSGSIESPFILYTLIPVLTASLLKDYPVTIIASLGTATLVLAAYVYNPVTHNTPTLQAVNDFLVYLIALALVAVLPYSVNVSVSRRLRSVAAAEERLRISRDLHDSVCQALCGLRWQVQRLSETADADTRLGQALDKMQTAVDIAEKDARELLDVLHTFTPETGFVAHVRRHLEELKSDTGINFEIEGEDADLQMDGTVQRELVMICSEALANIKKHSGARKVRLTAEAADGHVRVGINDDGVGFDPSSAGTGHGLSIMKERAALVGGTVRVTSAPGRGTRITIEVPREVEYDA